MINIRNIKRKFFIRRLIRRYKKYFYKNYFKNEPKLISKLQEAQDPKILIVSCCDSRVDPGVLFNLKPGEAFTIRNIANLVPNYKDSSGNGYYAVLSALEFAIYELDIQNIVVIGHSSCGGVNAIVHGYCPKHNDHSFINQWLHIAKELPLKRLDTQREYEIENIRLSVNNILSFPWIKKKIDDGKLSLSGIYVDIKTGNIEDIY